MQAGPVHDLMRAINSPFGANTKTCPSNACATNRRRHSSRLRIEFHEPMLVIGDQNTTVRGDFKSVGPALVLDRERPFAAGRDPEDASKGNVDDIEIALGIE